MHVHPVLTGYVGGMVLLAAYLALHPKIMCEVTLVDGRKFNAKLVNALCWGILWPAYLILVLFEAVYGKERSAKLVADKMGLDLSFAPNGDKTSLRLPGTPSDYPPIREGTTVLAGRRVGEWGLLVWKPEGPPPVDMTVDTINIYNVDAKNRALPPETTMSLYFPSLGEARAAMHAATPEQLGASLHSLVAVPPAPEDLELLAKMRAESPHRCHLCGERTLLPPRENEPSICGDCVLKAFESDDA